MSDRLKKILVLFGISLVVLGGYFFYVTSSDPLMEDTATDTTELTIASEKIYADIDRIGRLHIDTSLFNDSRFTSLKDTRVVVKQIPSGRANPFSSLE